jgi:hypothetical protein
VADDEPRPAVGEQRLERARDALGERRPRLAVRRRPRPAPPVRQAVALGVDLRRRAPAPRADVDLPPRRVEPLRRDAEQLGGLARPREVGADDALGRDREARDERRERARLRAAGVGEGRVELPLEPVLGVPGRLAVADEDEQG